MGVDEFVPENSMNAPAASLSLKVNGGVGSLDSFTAFSNFQPGLSTVIGLFENLHLLRNPGRSVSIV